MHLEVVRGYEEHRKEGTEAPIVSTPSANCILHLHRMGRSRNLLHAPGSIILRPCLFRITLIASPSPLKATTACLAQAHHVLPRLLYTRTRPREDCVLKHDKGDTWGNRARHPLRSGVWHDYIKPPTHTQARILWIDQL